MMARSEAHKIRNDQSRELFSTLEKTSILPPTGKMIPARATDLNIKHAVEEIPNSKNAKIHWLGDRTSTKVLLYFHGENTSTSSNSSQKMICSKPMLGGGYAMPPIDGHIIFLKACIDQVFEKTEEKLVVALLEYGMY